MLSRRTLLFASLAVVGLAASAGDAEAAQVAKLVAPAVAHTDPRESSKTIMTVSTRQPITGDATRLLVRESVLDASGTKWLRVMLPGRGHGRGGWISADRAQTYRNPYAIRVSLRARTATVTRKGKTIKRLRVVIGARKTPTPKGRFQIMEAVRQPRGSILGPWVLATNAYSSVLQEFAGGPGQIGLHGRTGLPDPLGSAASHGCVRFADGAISWLARTVDPGTPLTIR